jgi:putative two-component system response regulator
MCLSGKIFAAPLRTMKGVIPIVRHHHERWDGSGYPDRLKGHTIPWLVQVFQVIDIYDALVNERPYKPAFPIPQALEIMWDEVRQGWRNPELMAQFETFIKTTPPS